MLSPKPEPNQEYDNGKRMEGVYTPKGITLVCRQQSLVSLLEPRAGTFG